MDIELEDVAELRFADGSPVRAASAVVPFGDGFLVVQDDATYAAWVDGDSVEAVRLLPPVEGHEVFAEESGTKHLKPDLEAACPVTVDGRDAVLLLGSGSSPLRTRSALVHLDRGRPRVVAADLAPLYATVADALGIEPDVLNLEGACVVDGALRWYHRGLPSAGVPTGSVDLDLAEVLLAARGHLEPTRVGVSAARHHRLGDVEGVGLGTTDAVALPSGTVLLSAAAEDSPNTRDDGPVVGSALVHLVDHVVDDVTELPRVRGSVAKVEGLMALAADDDQIRLLAVVDGDDPDAPSLALRLRVRH